MSDKITREFYDLMASYGCAPRSIYDLIPDDKLHYIPCVLDKGNDKKLAYQYKVDGDLGVGWFMSFKHGSSAGTAVTFISKQPRNLSAQEKIKWAEKMREAKKLQELKDKARIARKKKAALLIKRAFSKMPKVEEHPYLEKKKVEPHGLRLREKTGELVIPVYQDDGLPWSVQKINAKGDKWFLRGGVVKNGYYPLAKSSDDRSVIVIAEGFSTAATIREVLGCVVVCAFNAGNLENIAVIMRKKYADSQIVIAADNDRFTKNSEGKEWNVGLEKAKIAAAKCGGFLIFPDFPESDIKGTDWNDYVLAHGEGQLREKMQRVIAARANSEESRDVVSGSIPTVRPPLELTGDWKENLICDKNGTPVKGSLNNAILYLKNFSKYKGVFRLNDFQKEIFVTKCPPWDSEQSFNVRRLDDNDISLCTAHMEHYGITPDTGKIFKAIAAAAESDKFHPARDYFNGLQWDGKERLKTWLSYYLGAEGDDLEYLSFIGKKWLTAGVKRIFEPGCKFDHILVIEGSQGRGKSTALEYMATFGRDKKESYFTDNIKIVDIQNKDTILMLQGSIIVELAELAGFNKKDDEEIKGWITVKEDRCRKPYERTVTVFPRQFVLAATTNSYDYLKDPTGNRRYWPFKSSALDLEAIQRDREQLWAEAVHLYKSGLYIGPNEEEMALAEIAQNKRMSQDSWEDDVLSAVEKLGLHVFNGFKIREVFRELGIGLRDQDLKSTRRITAILQSNGFVNEPKWIDGKTTRVWMKKDV